MHCTAPMHLSPNTAARSNLSTFCFHELIHKDLPSRANIFINHPKMLHISKQRKSFSWKTCFKRKASPVDQKGIIFGKVSNGLWPPLFRINIVEFYCFLMAKYRHHAICRFRNISNVNLWFEKYPPLIPLLKLFWKSICDLKLTYKYLILKYTSLIDWFICYGRGRFPNLPGMLYRESLLEIL